MSTTPQLQEHSLEDILSTYSFIEVHQMVFIYNAIMDGWTVKKTQTTGNFRFKKRLPSRENRQERQVYTDDGFLQRFVNNMQRLSSHTARARPPLNPSTEQVSSFELPCDQDVIIES